MKSLISEIKSILQESNVDTSAASRLENISGNISDDVKSNNLKAREKAEPKKKKKSGVDEDEDIVSSSKKDLEGSKEDSDKSEPESGKVATPDESPSTINLSDAADFEKLVDILNQFRAAHSFTDEEVSNRLRDYFDSLEREEKEVLHVLIKGLVQITVLDVSGKDAYTPTKLMYRIRKTGSASSEKKKSLKRKIDSSANSEKKGEDKKSDGGLPITTIGAGVKESKQQKLDLLSIVRRNNA